MDKRRIRIRRIGGILSALLILGGAMFALYPFFDEWRIERAQNRLLREYNEQYGITDEAPSKADERANLRYLESLSVRIDEILTDDSTPVVDPFLGIGVGGEADQMPAAPGWPVPTSTEPTTAPAPTEPLVVIGKLTIPKIELVLPILDKVTEYTLNNGVGHIAETDAIGEIGNVGIAGHRGRRRGVLFNRLDELVAGDEILIHSGGVVYEYVVYKTHIVKPDDNYVLNRSITERVLTLVTCDPIGRWDNRLVVHALQKPQ